MRECGYCGYRVDENDAETEYTILDRVRYVHLKCLPPEMQQMECAHRKSYVTDVAETGSDSVVISTFCPTCKLIWRDEEVGSLARAFAEDRAESLRERGRAVA